MSEIVVYAQAAVIDVRIELAPVHATAELERLVMRAIAAGIDELDALADVFGVTPRIMADLLGDLWTSGQITVDLGVDREAIALSAAGRQHLGRADNPESAHRTVAVSSVLLEKLTGRVLGERDGTFARDRRLIVPPMDDDRDVRQVRVSELEEAVRRNLEPRGGSIEFFNEQRITKVRPVPKQLGAPVRHRYVPIRLAVWRDGESLRVRLPDDPFIGLEIRERAAGRLQNVIASNPDSEFVRALHSYASKQADRVRTAPELAAELIRSTDGLASVDPGLRQSTHDRLSAIARTLTDYIASLVDREMDVEVVENDDDHLNAMQRLLDAAQVQIVMALPHVRVKGLAKLRPALERAVARGVRIFVIWGLEAGEDELAKDVKQELYAIARHGKQGGNVRFAGTPASIHAKVLIADDRGALVTSKNYLSESRFAEVGVVVWARDDRPSPAIEELLSWASGVLPNFELARQLLTSAEDFAVRDGALDYTRPVTPTFSQELLRQDAESAAVRLWGAAWRAAAIEIARGLTRTRPVVRPLRDGEHHDLVRDLLSTVKHRMVVTSHRVSGPVIARDLASRALSTTKHGVSVELMFGEYAADTSQADLDDLVGEGGNAEGAFLHIRARNHAKVLIADDIAVVGSFNYLAFSGKSRRRMSSEVSLEIVSPQIADEVASILGALTASSPRREQVAEPPSSAATLEEARQLVGILESAESDVHDVVDHARRAGVEETLAAIRGAGDPVACERLLLALVATETEAPHADWLWDLTELHASRGDWRIAAIFRQAILDAEAEPRAALFDALASDSEDLAVVADSLSGELTAAELEAFTAHLVAWHLLDGNTDLTAVLNLLRVEGPPTMKTLIGAALTHARDFGAVDVAALRVHETRVDRTARVDDGWGELEHAVMSLRNVDYRVQAGKLTIDFAFSDGEELWELESIVERRDVGQLGDWIYSHEPDDQRWVDQTAKRAGAPPIVGGLRTRFATRRRAIRAAAHSLLDTLGTQLSASRVLLPGERESLDAISTIATALDVSDSPPTLVTTIRARALSRLVWPAEPPHDGRTPEWRTPRLRSVSDARPIQRAAIVARDLFEVRVAEDALQVLLADPDLSAATEFIDATTNSGHADGRALDRMRRLFEIERDRRIEAFDARTAHAASLAERLGEDLPPAVERRRPGTDFGPDLEAALSTAESTLARIQQEFSERIRAEVTTRADVDASAAAYIEELIEAGEYASARDAVSHPAGLPSSDGTPPPPFRWHSWRLHELVYRLTHDDERPSGFDAFIPTEDDAAGWQVIDALKQLAAGDEGAEQAYVSAVQALVRPDAPAPRLTAGVAGATVRFQLPVPHSTPSISWSNESSVTVAVGDSRTSALFRLATDLEWNAEGPVIGVGDILTLLNAPEPTSRVDVRQRRLLRLVASRLPFDQVLDRAARSPGAPPIGPENLRRLLYVLGVDVGRVERDALVEMLGDHPFVLWRIVEKVKAESAGSISFRERRANPGFDKWIADAVLEDLGSASSIVVLGTVAEYGERAGLTREDLEQMLAILVEESWGGEKVPTDLSLFDIDAELARLSDQRYIEPDAEGRYRMVAKAPWYALRRTLLDDSWFGDDVGLTWFAHHVQKLVRTALSDYRRRIDETLLRQLLHNMRGTIVENGFADDREVRVGLDDLRDPEWPVNVANLLKVVARNFGGVRGIELFLPDVDEDLRVSGPYAQLAVVLQDALHNSVQSIRRASRGAPEGFVRVEVADVGSDVAFTVRDSGPGFSREVIDAFARGEVVSSPRGADHGHGMNAYRWFESDMSRVELANDPEGGAVVRFVVSRWVAD
ncbi:ATP-binding protein [Microbacterium sp. NPDC056569]|uniref:ATP-binding protein n=1 Tax=Microbacterium sp. NPDC056569 TaxID=3345867 RepID=UPI00367201AC